MRPNSIRVDPDERGARLSDLSRVNFGKVYTIEHSVKVKSFGMVNKDSMVALLYQFKDVWMPVFDTNPPPNAPQAPTARYAVAGPSSALPHPNLPQREHYTREELAERVQQPQRQRPLALTRSGSTGARSHRSKSGKSAASSRQKAPSRSDPHQSDDDADDDDSSSGSERDR